MINKIDMNQAIEDYVSGISSRESAEKNGVSATSLVRELKKLGLTRKYTRKKLDLPLSKSGRLTALDVHIFDKRVHYACQCDCGRKLRVRKRDYGILKECGACSSTGLGNHKWKGCGELSGTCWKHIKNSVVRKSRVLDFEITQEYVWKLYQKQDGKCALTGLLIPFPAKVVNGNFPSLDRIDSSKGYIEGNVQWVHKEINLMKWNLPQDRFFELCNLVTEKKQGGITCSLF